MKPLHLELYGFGAFAEPCKISFTDWQDGEVFLITGETGAGKTTIFDAICFALYGTASGSERESRQFGWNFWTTGNGIWSSQTQLMNGRNNVELEQWNKRQMQRCMSCCRTEKRLAFAVALKRLPVKLPNALVWKAHNFNRL